MAHNAFEQLVIAREFSVRRTELTCPAHSLKMMQKAAGSAADEVILDLEDSCAVSQKIEARRTLIEALRTLDFKGKIRAFRPNNIRTKFFYRDLIEVVEAAGQHVDVVVIPKVYLPEDVLFVDRLDREARKAAMRAIREAEWFGEQAPRVMVSPHPTNGLGL